MSHENRNNTRHNDRPSTRWRRGGGTVEERSQTNYVTDHTTPGRRLPPCSPLPTSSLSTHNSPTAALRSLQLTAPPNQVSQRRIRRRGWWFNHDVRCQNKTSGRNGRTRLRLLASSWYLLLILSTTFLILSTIRRSDENNHNNRSVRNDKNTISIATTTLRQISPGMNVLDYEDNKEVSRKQSTELLNNADSSYLTVHHHNLSNQHVHAIPNKLIFTHKYNLLEYQDASSSLRSFKEIDNDTELVALSDNVANSIALHATAKVYFWTDDECIASLRRVLPELVQYFLQEPKGMFKADLCRGTALYEMGGLYMDVDLGARLSLWTVLQPTTQFVTVRVHRHSLHPGAFFQAFVGATPRHAIVWQYLQQFLQYYQGMIPELDHDHDPLGVILLKRAYDQVLQGEQQQQQQKSGSFLSKYIELWQEVDYAEVKKQTIDIPPPIWNPQRRACRMIVMARAPTTASAVSSIGSEVVVPFYSRIANSRMCPDNHNQLKNDKNKNSTEPLNQSVPQ